MARDQNFENDGQEFNIRLEASGDLHFKANGKNGDGSTRMVISDDSGEVAIGGSGEFGQLQLKGSTGANTVFIGGSGPKAVALLGGGAGQAGEVQLFDANGRRTLDLDGSLGLLTLGTEGVDGDLIVRNGSGTTTIQADGDTSTIQLFSGSGTRRAELQGSTGRLQFSNGSAVVTADLRGDAGSLLLGAANATDGDLMLTDLSGAITINCDGATGSIVCVSLTETSDARLKTNIKHQATDQRTGPRPGIAGSAL